MADNSRQIPSADVIEGMREALQELYDLCITLGSFKNGVEYNGMDEGDVFASGVLDKARAALALPDSKPDNRGGA